jgi:surface polysaccharide O-acyltransferase-like enzyme
MSAERLDWCDAMRAIACLMVIGLHAAGPFIPIRMEHSWLTLPAIVEAATRPAVPLFFALSGFLVLRRTAEVTVSTAMMRLMRLLFPLIFYSAIFAVFNLYVGQPVTNPLVAPEFYHLWYFYSAIIVALLLCVFRDANVDPALGALICGGILLFCSGGIVVVGWSHMFVQISLAGVYLVYAVAGIYLGRVKFSRLFAILSFGVFCVSTIAVSLLTAMASEKSGYLDITNMTRCWS